MNKGLKYTGAINDDELKKCKGFPPEERFKKGPVAVIECIEEIPCNPCEASCPSRAIRVGNPITNVPVLIEEKCKGCGLCVASCPGLAIFIEDHTYSDTEALVGMPYEYGYELKAGDRVKAVDREGKFVTDAIVKKVVDTVRNDRTKVLYITVPKELAHVVRGIDFR